MKSKRNILDLKTRRDIYQLISENPGLHISELSKKKGIPRSTVRYHLNYLRKLHLINVKADGKDRRLYASNQLGSQDKEFLSIVRQRIPFKIIMYLFFPGPCSKAELAKELDLHPTTINHHISKLLEKDIIKPVEVKNGKFVSYQRHKPIVYKKPVGREIFYAWKNSDIKEDMYALLITYKENMPDPKIIDVYLDFVKHWGRKKYKKYFSFDPAIDNIIEVLGEIGMYPYRF